MRKRLKRIKPWSPSVSFLSSEGFFHLTTYNMTLVCLLKGLNINCVFPMRTVQRPWKNKWTELILAKSKWRNSYAVNRIFEERYVVLVLIFRLISFSGYRQPGEITTALCAGFYMFLPQGLYLFGVRTVWYHMYGACIMQFRPKTGLAPVIPS